MRTSRLSKDTAKVLHSLSPPSRRQTRSDALHSFAFQGTSPLDANQDIRPPHGLDLSDDASSLSSVDTLDIEDTLEPSPKKRRQNAGTPVARGSTTTTSTTTTTRSCSRSTSTRSAFRRTTVTKDDASSSEPTAPPKARRLPPRTLRVRDGVKVDPPSNWEAMYNTVKRMRERNPTAPVDTMGCAELYSRTSPPRDRRFQTLIALMLSSQTKDTVTAMAMQRLHTELGDGVCSAPGEFPDVKKEEDGDGSGTLACRPSTLTLGNILAVAPDRLNELIRTVGFHNNKTKYIKAAATILRNQYNSDIPATAEELMKLPGVGPKMAYLCMSAAWGKDEGIGVDVHVHRITNLWGWHKTKSPEETRVALESWLPKDKWHEINKLLVGLGQTVCLPVGRRCGECDLAGTKLCKSEVRGLRTKQASRDSPKMEILVDEADEAKVKAEGA